MVVEVEAEFSAVGKIASVELFDDLNSGEERAAASIVTLSSSSMLFCWRRPSLLDREASTDTVSESTCAPCGMFETCCGSEGIGFCGNNAGLVGIWLINEGCCWINEGYCGMNDGACEIKAGWLWIGYAANCGLYVKCCRGTYEIGYEIA